MRRLTKNKELYDSIANKRVRQRKLKDNRRGRNACAHKKEADFDVIIVVV